MVTIGSHGNPNPGDYIVTCVVNRGCDSDSLEELKVVWSGVYEEGDLEAKEISSDSRDVNYYTVKRKRVRRFRRLVSVWTAVSSCRRCWPNHGRMGIWISRAGFRTWTWKEVPLPTSHSGRYTRKNQRYNQLGLFELSRKSGNSNDDGG